MGSKKKKSKKKKNSSKRKINISLALSVIAVLISLLHFIFDNPYVVRSINRVKVIAEERGLSKHPNLSTVQSSFFIENTGNNTAEDVELHLRILKGDNVLFIPEVFTLVKGDKNNGLAKNLIYKCEKLVPGEFVRIYVHSNFENFLETNSIDTLFYNKSAARPQFNFGPYISDLKHSKGKVNVVEKDSLNLKEMRFLN